MLALSLKRITTALHRTAATINADVRIMLDHCRPERVEETEYVRDNFYPDALIFRANTHILVPSGCWNILESLKHGYQTGADYVFLIEEDVMVYPDFFDWHLSTQNSGDYFASCGRLIERYGRDYYTNPGSCFNRKSLGLLVPHICVSYFAGRKAYLEENFPVWPEASDLDDGLIRRVIKKHDGKLIFPDTPKCAHQGFRMYNQIDRYMNIGTIQERIDRLQVMFSEIRPEDRYAQDFEPFIS